MPRLTFKNTIEKEEKEKEKFEKQKYIRMRKLLSELRNALKPNEEDDRSGNRQSSDQALQRPFTKWLSLRDENHQQRASGDRSAVF